MSESAKFTLVSVIAAGAAVLTTPSTLADDLYHSHLARVSANENAVAFVATCSFANGNVGVLMFSEARSVGRYFELSHSHTVNSGVVSVSNGGYNFKPTGQREPERSRRAMKTLITAGYHVLTSHEFDTVTQVPPRQSCFEAVP